MFALTLLLLAAAEGAAVLAAVFAGAAGVGAGRAVGTGACACAGTGGADVFCTGVDGAEGACAEVVLGAFVKTEAKDGAGNNATWMGEMSSGGGVAWRVPATSSQPKAMCNSKATAMIPMRFCMGIEKG